MGRIARPPTAHAEILRRSLRAYLSNRNLSLNAFAQSQGITQSTLYRFATGQTKEPSAVMLPALNYAHNALSEERPEQASGKPVASPLQQLALKACGNQVDEALILEQLVLALAPVVRAITRKRTERRDD